MYPTPWKDSINGVFHDWPRWQGELTISEFAQRIIREHRIADGDTLIGSSLGGIISAEISQHLRIEKMVLIGSATRKEEINGLLDILHPLIDFSPIAFVKACAGKIPTELTKMFSESDPDLIRAMCKAIFSWEGIPDDTRVYRIHGTRDFVIPNPDRVDLPIQGGHLIAITHPIDCLNALRVEQVAAGTSLRAVPEL